MDKQSLKKHHFWILLALAVVLIPVVMGGTVFGVGSAATKEKAAIDKKLSDLRAASPKSVQYLAELEKQKGVLTEQRDKVWKEVYEAQAGLIHWPEALRARLDPLYFGDKLPEEIRSPYRNDYYRPEYLTLPEIIKPTEFADRDWQKVLQHVLWTKDPTDEECWLSLETLCVQREILRDIQAVNLMLASFIPVPNPAEKEPTDPEAKKAFVARIAREKADVEAAKKKLDVKDGEAFGRFISPYWQLDLVAEKPKASRDKDKAREGEVVFRGEIVNRSGHRQNLARVDFMVWFADRTTDPNSPPVILPIQHEYLTAGETFAFKDVRAPGSLRSGKIYAVEQKLDNRFAPVKRVDKLVLSYPSHRHGDRTLVAANGPAFEEAKKAAEAAAAATPQTPGAFPGGGRDEGRGMGGQAAVNATPNGIPRERYLGRSDQVRWMPIAVTMIVDQSHIQDVTRAFANSKLRFQGTQMHWQRFRGQLGIGIDSATGTSDPTMMPGGDGMPNRGRFDPDRGSSDGGPPRVRGNRGAAPRGDDGPTSGSGRPGVVTPGGTGATGGRFGGGNSPGGINVTPGAGAGITIGTGEVDDGPANLVEVTIYGIASLYEKYPPRTPADPSAQPATPPQPDAAIPPTPASGQPATPAPATPAPATTAPTTPTPATPAPPTPPAPATPPVPPPGPTP